MLRKTHLKRNRIYYLITIQLFMTFSCAVIQNRKSTINLAKSQIEFVNESIPMLVRDTVVIRDNQKLIRINAVTYIGYMMNDSLTMISSIVFDNNYFELYTGAKGYEIDYEKYLDEHSFYKLKNNRVIFNDYVRFHINLNNLFDKIKRYEGPISTCDSFIYTGNWSEKIKDFTSYISILKQENNLLIELTPIIIDDSVKQQLIVKRQIQILKTFFFDNKVDFEIQKSKIGMSYLSGIDVKFLTKKNKHNSYKIKHLPALSK